MNFTITIPPMTDPMSIGWDQPSTANILIDETHAIVPKDVFDKLKNYSCTIPTGVYSGKMWKREYEEKRKTKWQLCWFGDEIEKDLFNTYAREIIIL